MPAISYCLFDMDGLLLDTGTLRVHVAISLLIPRSPDIRTDDISIYISIYRDMCILTDLTAHDDHTTPTIPPPFPHPSSERIYTEVTETIVGRYGRTFDWSLKSRMMGMKERDAAQLLVHTLDLSG